MFSMHFLRQLVLVLWRGLCMLVIVHVGEQVFPWLGKSAGGEILKGISLEVSTLFWKTLEY